MVLCKTGSVTPHARFKAEVYILKKEKVEGIPPKQLQTTVLLRTTDVTAVSPRSRNEAGDNLTINVDLIQPVALNTGLRFAIREVEELLVLASDRDSRLNKMF